MLNEFLAGFSLLGIPLSVVCLVCCKNILSEGHKLFALDLTQIDSLLKINAHTQKLKPTGF
jgi:hypothetical protein